MLRNKIINFLASYNCDQYDVSFQCDSDCIDFAKDVGLQHASKGEVHTIADVIAWLNSHEQELPGIISLDLFHTLQEYMMK